jgi:hypothetical protein
VKSLERDGVAKAVEKNAERENGEQEQEVTSQPSEH